MKVTGKKVSKYVKAENKKNAEKFDEKGNTF